MNNSELQKDCQTAINVVARDLATKLDGKLNAGEIKRDVAGIFEPDARVNPHGQRVITASMMERSKNKTWQGFGPAPFDAFESLVNNQKYGWLERFRLFQTMHELRNEECSKLVESLVVLSLVQLKNGFDLSDGGQANACIQMIELLKNHPLTQEFAKKYETDIEQALVGYIKKEVLEVGALDSYLKSVIKDNTANNPAVDALNDALQRLHSINLIELFRINNPKALRDAIQPLETAEAINEKLVDMACVYLGDVLKENKPQSLIEYLAAKKPKPDLSASPSVIKTASDKFLENDMS